MSRVAAALHGNKARAAPCAGPLVAGGWRACWWHYLLAGPQDSGWLSSARPEQAGSLGHITSQPGSPGTSKECERDVHQHR